MPCSPLDVSLNVPSGPSGPAIPGFGTPFAIKLPEISAFPAGFPEDILDLLNRFQFLIPPGALKPSLSPNFSKDIFDTILSLLDQFFPFLMLYKFFLPILNIIICVIEVLCALLNPFALISAINRLFNRCIPDFLNMFPVFALIIMIISLLRLILALIEYVTAQILKLVQVILRNIIALENAFQSGDANGVLAIAHKLGALLCIFQNLFVLFSLFNIVLDIVKEILNLAFSIPPCQDSFSGDTNSCCTPETCPAIVKAPYTNFTGTFEYFPELGVETSISFPPPFGNFNFALRNELWQFFDVDQTQAQAFRNIFDAFDITATFPKPVFFPAGTTYAPGSDLKQVPYMVDMRMFYDPAPWGRTDLPRFIRFTNCIVSTVPTTNLIEADNTTQQVQNAVTLLVGGSGFEDDGVTPLPAYGPDGVTPIGGTATIENFFHMPAEFTPGDSFIPPNFNDGYTFQNVEYTFKPNTIPLVQRNIVTVGCVPDVAFNRSFIGNVFASDVGLKTQLLSSLVNSQNGNIFPDTAAAQNCMLTAVANLRSNLTPQGVADFQTTTTLCLQKLQSDTNSALSSLVGIGFDACKSNFTLNPSVQFTSRPILVTVNINEKNGLPITAGLSTEAANNVASRITPFITFGNITPFSYDGYQAFTANISSPIPGDGQIMVSFDNNIMCTNTFSADSTVAPTHTLQTLDYKFVYTSAITTGTEVEPGISSGSGTFTGGPDGQPRRDSGDISRDGQDDDGSN